MGKISQAVALFESAVARASSGVERPSLPPELQPGNLAEAYAIQHEVAAGFGAIGGWKTETRGEGEPILCAALPISALRASGACFAATTEQKVRIVLAVQLIASLARLNAPFTRNEAIAAIGTVHPAAEILAPRVADGDANALVSVADSLGAGPLVIGRSIATWRSFDPTKLTVTLAIDDRPRRYEGRAEYDIPNLLAWLGASGAAWADGLYVGHVVTLGLGIAPITVGPKAKVRVAIGSLGALEFRFVAPS